MDFFRGLFNKSEKPVPPPPPPLTEEEITNTVLEFSKKGNPNPSNEEIANMLKRTVEDVEAVRIKIKKPLPKSPLFNSRYFEFSGPLPLTQYNPLEPHSNWLSSKKEGGRKIKNKKKHNKLSRRRRQPDSKKNRKSMKHK
jgi:hypothetical protein